MSGVCPASDRTPCRNPPAVHRAFHWLAPAPVARCASWQWRFSAFPPRLRAKGRALRGSSNRFRQLGLANPHLDSGGNAVAEIPGATMQASTPVILISAHLDTVFPAGTATDPVEQGHTHPRAGSLRQRGGPFRLLGWRGDAARGAHSGGADPVCRERRGEEGEGDLRGHALSLPGRRVRFTHRCCDGARRRRHFRGRHRALPAGAFASRSLDRAATRGPDAGAVNPHPAAGPRAARARTWTCRMATADHANVGQISGGTSVNSNS